MEMEENPARILERVEKGRSFQGKGP